MNIQIPDYRKSKVLVIGDVMLDRYWLGSATKISPEAPVPVVNHRQILESAGGAANVAMNLACLGVQTKIIGITGDDNDATILKNILSKQNISFDFCLSKKPTITKTRIMSQHQQLLRVDNEKLPLTSNSLFDIIENNIDDFDYIVLSDYGKGTLSDVKAIIELINSKGKKALVDPKGNDFTKYTGSFLITPNLSEFKQISGDINSEEELESKANKLILELNLNSLLLTRSEDGVSLFQKTENGIKHIKHKTKAKEVYDVTGAGDTVIATLAASLAANCSLDDSVELANLAAGVVVAKTGTATLTARELDKALHQSRFIQQGFVSKEILLNELEKAKAKGESIVMTNGCFDILHTGHVNYLEQAKKLGDRLLVAINSDASITELKGPDRPANKLESRANVLAALRSVDWVVCFSEQTPTKIISECKPDFLVKGGDNNPDEIPGAKEVRENGGEVMVMDYIDGFSTTNTINRIKDKK